MNDLQPAVKRDELPSIKFTSASQPAAKQLLLLSQLQSHLHYRSQM